MSTEVKIRNSSSVGLVLVDSHRLYYYTRKEKIVAGSAEAGLYAAALGASESKGIVRRVKRDHHFRLGHQGAQSGSDREVCRNPRIRQKCRFRSSQQQTLAACKSNRVRSCRAGNRAKENDELLRGAWSTDHAPVATREATSGAEALQKASPVEASKFLMLMSRRMQRSR